MWLCFLQEGIHSNQICRLLEKWGAFFFVYVFFLSVNVVGFYIFFFLFLFCSPIKYSDYAKMVITFVMVETNKPHEQGTKAFEQNAIVFLYGYATFLLIGDEYLLNVIWRRSLYMIIQCNWSRKDAKCQRHHISAVTFFLNWHETTMKKQYSTDWLTTDESTK